MIIDPNVFLSQYGGYILSGITGGVSVLIAKLRRERQRGYNEATEKSKNEMCLQRIETSIAENVRVTKELSVKLDSEIDEGRSQHKSLYDKLDEMNTRTSRIEGHLGII